MVARSASRYFSATACTSAARRIGITAVGERVSARDFQQNQPAIMFFTEDIKGDYEKVKGRGAEFTMPPTDVTGSTIAMLKDTCGNLVQLTQLAKW